MSESATALGAFRDDPAGMVAACRRIIDRHLTCGPLWWLCATMLCSPESMADGRRAADALQDDPTGALLAQTTAYVSLEMLEFQRSADVLLTLIIGGTGWLYGGIAGAIAFKVLQDVLSSSAPQFWMFWMGIFLVVLALVGRERLARSVRGLLEKVVP